MNDSVSKLSLTLRIFFANLAPAAARGARSPRNTASTNPGHDLLPSEPHGRRSRRCLCEERPAAEGDGGRREGGRAGRRPPHKPVRHGSPLKSSSAACEKMCSCSRGVVCTVQRLLRPTHEALEHDFVCAQHRAHVSNRKRSHPSCPSEKKVDHLRADYVNTTLLMYHCLSTKSFLAEGRTRHTRVEQVPALRVGARCG